MIICGKAENAATVDVDDKNQVIDPDTWDNKIGYITLPYLINPLHLQTLNQIREIMMLLADRSLHVVGYPTYSKAFVQQYLLTSIPPQNWIS
jgi:hypothetical protein